MAGGVSYDAGFDSLDATELRLGLPGSAGGVEKPMPAAPRVGKRALPEADDESKKSGAEAAPVAKAQVVGWPPVRSFRRNLSSMAKKSEEGEEEEAMAGVLVKVSMDGAPYLRKTDLKLYKGYKELRLALEAMFKCFSLGEISAMEGCNGCEYAITYQDKDGDWMLVGDVPWQMFISSCKRLRIMRGSEARGLGSRP